eukprot:1411456-Pyramimonas_sp.AAC.2
MQEARVYPHDEPVVCRKHRYVLTRVSHGQKASGCGKEQGASSGGGLVMYGLAGVGNERAQSAQERSPRADPLRVNPLDLYQTLRRGLLP